MTVVGTHLGVPEMSRQIVTLLPELERDYLMHFDRMGYIGEAGLVREKMFR